MTTKCLHSQIAMIALIFHSIHHKEKEGGMNPYTVCSYLQVELQLQLGYVFVSLLWWWEGGWEKMARQRKRKDTHFSLLVFFKELFDLKASESQTESTV